MGFGLAYRGLNLNHITSHPFLFSVPLLYHIQRIYSSLFCKSFMNLLFIFALCPLGLDLLSPPRYI
jgi:hypothetical protein